jgi:hypothetical protein
MVKVIPIRENFRQCCKQGIYFPFFGIKTMRYVVLSLDIIPCFKPMSNQPDLDSQGNEHKVKKKKKREFHRYSTVTD